MPVIAPRGLTQLLRQVGTASSDARTNLVAIALAESGGELSLVQGTRRGPWQIDDSRGFDRRLMALDGAYAAARAVEISGGGLTLDSWPSWTSGRYSAFVNAARQAEAQSASVVGSILAEDGTYVPPGYYDNASPAAIVARGMDVAAQPGVGAPIGAAFEQDGPLTGLRITGTELTGDVSASVIGSPVYEAGWTTVPNLSFSIADPEGDLLWHQRNLWVQGARVEYLDLDLRIDVIEFSPGPATTGQITITAIDNIIYQLQKLRGARTASGVSPTSFVRSELQLAGIDPNRFFLGEAMPTQTEIARDIPDQAGSGGEGDAPSAWTTVQRLAKETGKRTFVSGRKLVFGSAVFAMDWCAPGDLRIGWHNSPEGERWQSLPSAKTTSVGDRTGVTEVTGTVPLNRARYFRPGVSVIVHNTPSVAAGDRRFVCTDISHTLSRDTDGADITLIEPIELAPEAKT